jgi:hypothetical protein
MRAHFHVPTQVRLAGPCGIAVQRERGAAVESCWWGRGNCRELLGGVKRSLSISTILCRVSATGLGVLSLDDIPRGTRSHPFAIGSTVVFPEEG